MLFLVGVFDPLGRYMVPMLPVACLLCALGISVGLRPCRDVVRLEAEPAFAEPVTLRLDRLAAGEPHTLERPALALAPGFLGAQDERAEGHLIVTAAVGGRQVARTVAPVSVLPPAHWPGGGVLPELLAAWVRPNSKALPPLLRDAADRLARATGRGGLDGYQSRDPRRGWATAKVSSWPSLPQREDP